MKQIVYIVTADNRSIEVWKLLKSGNMVLIQIINTNNNIGQPLLISKKRNTLYVGTRYKCTILIYNILLDGQLKQKGLLILPYSSNHLSFDCKENFLFCSYYQANCISIHMINKYDIPNPPIQIINHIHGCHSTNIDLSNKLVFSPALLSDRIYLYHFNDSKKSIFPLNFLKYISCMKNSGPRHMTFHHNKKYAYSINEINGTIDVWKINTIQKIINHIQNISLSGKLDNSFKKYWSADIHLTKCGKYLYTCDRLHNKIIAFKVHSDNTLSIINKYNTVNQPRSFYIDQNNKYLISIGQKSNTMMIYNILINNGELNLLYEYSVGKNPIWILIHQI